MDGHFNRDAVGDALVHRLIEAQVKQHPDKTALVFQDRKLTYRQLNDRANRIAHFLKHQGIGADQLVGVHMDHSLDMVVAILAILKAGGAYLPLDPAYPDERLRFMLEDSRAKIILTQSSLIDTAPGHTGAQIVALDGEDFQTFSAANIPGGDAAQLAYVIYTSGSTGQPKGVLIEHRSVVNYILAAVENFGTNSSDRVLLFSTINFDASVEEMLTALVSGATLVIRTDDMVTSIPLFLRKLEEWGITAMSLPTAFWHELVVEMDGGMGELPAALRYVVIGGEKARAARLARWRQLTKVPLWNTYGPTETTIAVTMGKVSDADTSQEVPLGKPVTGVDLHLLDDNLEPVRQGDAGELYFSGVQVARGYLNRPELTAARFISNPRNRHQRMYKSGDLARFRPDGELEFLGRADDQIKLRGFRIELGEIEAILDQVSRGAVVLAKENEAGDLRLAAYVVSEKSVEDIQAHLKDRLPAYMLPSVYVKMDRLPVTAGGKTDKRSLPEPDWGQRVGARKFVAPRNDVETRLATIWADALAMPAISVTDDFFENGGHSLLAIRIFARLEKEFGVSLPLATLFRAPTIEQFAKILSSDQRAASGKFHPAVVPIQPGGTRPAFFCVGGGVINLKNIATQLGSDQPFHALQWQGLTDAQMLDGTLSDIAATFIEAMKSVQPAGPYHLGGSFTAGMVAVEMARQLQSRGEEVALLAGFDAVVERYASPTAYPDVNHDKKPRSVRARIFRLIAKGPRFIWETHLTNPIYREKLQHVLWKIALGFYHAIERPLPNWMRTGMGEEFFILQVTANHRPEEKFKGDFELYLTPRNYRKYSALPKCGWNAWIAGAVHAHQTPGEPCTIMLEPNVARLAGHFRQQIHNVMAQAGAGA